MSSGAEPNYHVVYLDKVRQAVKELLLRAREKGLGEQVLQAILTIDKRLAENPLEFGDPWYNLEKAKLKVMMRVIPPLTVVYGVHEEEKTVFVREIKPYPNNIF